MEHSTPPAVTFERDVAVPMRDGTSLRADVWRPSAEAPCPVLLQRTPYGKSSSVTHIDSSLEPLRAIDRGFAVVIQDCRGRSASDGTFRPYADERPDGFDTVAWVAEQDWCDGRVCMYGTSYAGTAQLLAAAAEPPALAAIAPNLAGSNRETVFEGGAFQLGIALAWVLLGVLPGELERRLEREEPSADLEAAFVEALERGADVYDHLPVDQNPLWSQADDDFADWFGREDDDAYWEARSYTQSFDRIAVPALHIGGWYDVFLAGTLQSYSALRSRAATAYARDGQRLVVGPWTHDTLAEAFGPTVGERDFGPFSTRAAIELEDLQLAFFEAVLAGRSPAGPAARIFVMGTNRWREEEDWPPRRTTTTPYYLHGPEEPDEEEPTGLLSTDPPAATSRPDCFLYDPIDPTPSWGGPLLSLTAPGHFPGPRDQSRPPVRSDGLIYISPALDRDLEVIGPIRVHLHVSSSARATDFTVKLEDVYPDGRVFNVAEGIRRCRFAERTEPGSWSSPGESSEVVIDARATSNVFRAGHRIRIQVGSSNYPRFDRHPNSDVISTAAPETEMQSAVQYVFHDYEHPSRVLLPVLGDLTI